MPVTSHKYSNEEITVVWQPNLCIHSTICWKGLRQVFDPAVKPWIKVQGATTQTIIEQVRKCPSGALSYFVNNIMEQSAWPDLIKAEQSVITDTEITPNGPMVIGSDHKTIFADGHEQIQKETVSICRCGRSSNKPYCDDSHLSTTVQG
ncbi:MAG TPA: (4Fe-4S)-binding protein [Panacibacter sp.]|nr:(4Fe-4S)-binding protein [Panacibacter sp.]HNP43045.1 (4Fe-4S)-binding protein [Panacibacter sp.]